MIPFVKAHACGNDFLVVEETLANNNHAGMARLLCSRNYSVGADGVEFLARKDDGTFFLRLFNADGSEAELSGNGTRCVAAWLAYSEGLRDTTMGTPGGTKQCRVIECGDDAHEEHFLIQTSMGVPKVLEQAVVVDGVGEVAGAVVDVGNPHFVIFTDHPAFRASGLGWEELGAMICTHKDFPKGTNVEFVRVISKGEIAFRIYERGVGPTQSSGTGTSASAAASIVLLGCDRSLTASSLGGAQQVVWNDGEQLMLTGPAEIVCKGEVSLQGLAS
ncbi:diaminopimelate epimerase [Terriglobus roseus DSM 18391]|uniref:Diaminopimelate epimerase n=1 Tax=Terriglobus roseus (strain DSM 18391 / NRRL B-41598 / KBS 63) TaxID=926566 RepID=I3ZL66_TERRK|nr:diaminopimelate epimerase [Terriglobus roseus]AFL89984.1 diaminopimelate epimerase [Terriglobus roseus DSM 18391]